MQLKTISLICGIAYILYSILFGFASFYSAYITFSTLSDVATYSIPQVLNHFVHFMTGIFFIMFSRKM
jgi:hypothetical protein